MKKRIKYVAKEIINRLGYFIKIVDWNKKESLRAQIKMELKRILSNTIGKKAEWKDIERIAGRIDEQIELLYAA
jgi:type I restriction enzyme R subunit